jgi:hypothetical protein
MKEKKKIKGEKNIMEKWFNQQSLLVKLLLLLIPGVNYVVEILLRWGQWSKKQSVIRLVLAIIATVPTGIALGFIDLIVVLLTGKVLTLD